MTVIYPVSSSCSTAADNLGRPFIPWRVIFSMSETRRIPGVIRGHKVSFSPCLARCPTRPPLLLSFHLFRRPRWNLPRLLRRRLRSPMVRQVWSLISRRTLRGKRPRDPNKDCSQQRAAATNTAIFTGQLSLKVSHVVDTKLL